MSFDASIYRMAARETDSLLVAQVLVAKKRSELETRVVLKTVEDGAPATGADLERSLGDMNRESAERAKIIGRHIDRTA
jgi:uncharacterized protein (DUF2336 family)